MNKLISDDLLSANYVDGQVLYGEDLNKIVRVLKESLNISWAFIQTIIGENTDVIYTESLEALLEWTPDDGTYGYVVNITRDTSGNISSISGLSLYQYFNSAWNLKRLGFRTYLQETQPEGMADTELWFDTTIE